MVLCSLQVLSSFPTSSCCSLSDYLSSFWSWVWVSSPVRDHWPVGNMHLHSRVSYFRTAYSVYIYISYLKPWTLMYVFKGKYQLSPEKKEGTLRSVFSRVIIFTRYIYTRIKYMSAISVAYWFKNCPCRSILKTKYKGK